MTTCGNFMRNVGKNPPLILMSTGFTDAALMRTKTSPGFRTGFGHASVTCSTDGGPVVSMYAAFIVADIAAADRKLATPKTTQECCNCVERSAPVLRKGYYITMVSW